MKSLRRLYKMNVYKIEQLAMYTHSKDSYMIILSHSMITNIYSQIDTYYIFFCLSFRRRQQFETGLHNEILCFL